MNPIEFKRLLYRTAFCAMTCDGVVDDREIAELSEIDRETAYFRDLDLSGELSELTDGLRFKGRELLQGLITEVRSTELSWVQEMLLVEVVLRIIGADEHHDANEVRFLRMLRSALSVPDEVLLDRFGDLPWKMGMLRENVDLFRVPDFGFEAAFSSLPELKSMDLSSIEEPK